MSRTYLAYFYRLTWENGTAIVLLSAIFFSFQHALLRIAEETVPVFEAAFFVGALATGAILVAELVYNVRPILGHRLNLLLARGVIGFLGVAATYSSIHLVPLHDFSSIFFLYPALTVVLAWLFLGESLSWLALLGIALGLAGVPVLTQPSFLFGGPPWTLERTTGIILALLGSVAMGGKELGCSRWAG